MGNLSSGNFNRVLNINLFICNVYCYFFFFNKERETVRSFHIVLVFTSPSCLYFFLLFHSLSSSSTYFDMYMRRHAVFPSPLTIGNLLQGSQYVNEELTLGFVNGSGVCIL